MKEGWGLFLSFGYVLLVLWGLRVLEEKGHLSPFEARKGIHILVGSWMVPTFFLFDHWYMAILPPFSFIWVNLTLERKRFFSFDAKSEGYGAVYFPIAFVLLLTLFWEEPVRVYACLGGLTLAWGDALAALVGKRWGHHPYRIGPFRKSLEGTMAMMAGAFAASYFSFFLFQPGEAGSVVAQSALVAAWATLMESLVGRGIDNITIPLGSAFFAYFLFSGR